MALKPSYLSLRNLGIPITGFVRRRREVGLGAVMAGERGNITETKARVDYRAGKGGGVSGVGGGGGGVAGVRMIYTIGRLKM